MKTLLFVVQLALGILLPLSIQLWDRKRLGAEERARAWNSASWGSALYAFGPLSMLGWFWVTRRSALGLATGVLCSALLVGALAGLHRALEAALGLG